MGGTEGGKVGETGRGEGGSRERRDRDKEGMSDARKGRGLGTVIVHRTFIAPCIDLRWLIFNAGLERQNMRGRRPPYNSLVSLGALQTLLTRRELLKRNKRKRAIQAHGVDEWVTASEHKCVSMNGVKEVRARLNIRRDIKHRRGDENANHDGEQSCDVTHVS